MPFILALVLTLLGTPVLIWAANKHGLLDLPDERKCHQDAIPLVGGLSMSFAVAISAAWHLADASVIWGLFAAVSIIVMVGFVDDCIGLPVGLRFLAQAIAGLIMALFADAQLTNLGDLFGAGAITLGIAALPFSIFAIAGVANAVNMSDGMDGLAGGLALISTAFVAVAAYLSGGELTFNTLLILSGALIGFLYFNMRFPWQQRARVFMGDSGSLMLGFVLAWAVIRVTQTEENALSPAAALWFFAIPLWDAVSLILRRVCRGKSPFHPGRDHLHHILLRVGYTDSQVVRFIHLAAVGFGLVGLGGWWLGVPDAAMLYGFLAIFALYCVGVRYAWKLMRLIVPLHTRA